MKKKLKRLTDSFNILFLLIGEKKEGCGISSHVKLHSSSNHLSDQDLKDILETPNVFMCVKDMNYS